MNHWEQLLHHQNQRRVSSWGMVTTRRDTGIVIAGHDIGRTTGVGIIAGGAAGAMIGGKKHRVIGALAGIVGGFFLGRWEDDRIAQGAKDGFAKILGA